MNKRNIEAYLKCRVGVTSLVNTMDVKYDLTFNTLFFILKHTCFLLNYRGH